VSRKPSQATLLVDLALETEGLELFHTRGFESHVMLPAGTHRECWSVKSTAFRRWLSRLFFECAGVAPGGQALTDALGVLEGSALFEGIEHEVHLRLAADEHGSVWVDLCDEFWQAIRINSQGWRIVHDPPVRFRRARGMLPLPNPQGRNPRHASPVCQRRGGRLAAVSRLARRRTPATRPVRRAARPR
jgi:hypothetical protein